MASKTSFYNNSGVTNEQSNAIDASVSNAAASETAAANSASSASASAATSTASKDAAVVAKNAAVVAKNAAVVAKNAAEAAAGGVSGALAISNNLSDLANASTARTNLGVAIGSNVQAYSSVLQSTTAAYTSALNTKLSGIEASADVTDTANVVAALTAGTNITIASNGTIASTASGGTSYTHPNHSGEVTSTGDGATVIASNVVDADNLKVTGNGSNTQFLRSDGDGTFTWATPVDTNTTYSVGDGGLTTNDFTNADHSKLNAIEANATADQTNAEIRAAVEAASDSNVFTDADHSKLNAIESNATADQTASEIRTLVESATDSNIFTDADHTKLNAIEASADVTDTANVVAALTAGTNVSIAANGTISSTDTNTTYSVGDGGLTTNDFTNADHSKLDGIAASANNYTHPNHSGEVTSTADGATVIADNVVDEANLKVSNTPTNGYVLTAQSGNTGGLTWAAAASGGGADLYTANESSPTAQPSATGTNAIAIGDSAVSTGANSFAGPRTRATGADSVAFGQGNSGTSYGAQNAYAVCMGQNTKTSGRHGIAMGFVNQATALQSYCIGYGNSATHSQSFLFGGNIASTASNQVSIGGTQDDVRISETYTLPKVDGTASGQVLTTNGSGAVSWATPASGGGGADLYTANESSPTAQPSATGTNAIAIGDSAVSAGSRTTAFSKSRAAGWDSIAGAILNNTSSYGTTHEGNIAFGEKAKVTGSASQGIGKLSVTSGAQSMGLGYTATASGLRSYAFGYGATASHTDSVSIGRSATSTASNQVNIGADTQDVRISETYTLPKVDGTANGQVLTTNGSGTVSWATPASGGGAYEFIASTGAITSSTSSVVFDSSHFASGSYRNYVFKFANVKIQSDSWYLQLHVSYDNGSSYETGNIYLDGATLRNFSLLTLNGLGTDTNESGVSGEMLLYNPHETSAYTYFQTHFAYMTSSGSLVREKGVREQLHLIKNTSAINNIKITVGSGNFASGYVDMYGIKKA